MSNWWSMLSAWFENVTKSILCFKKTAEFARSFSWVFTFHRKCTWAQLYRNSADQITDHRTTTPGLCFNHSRGLYKANISCELPKHRQHVTCPSRESNILDHCYTTIKNAYHSVPRAALGLSDYCLVHLIPTYRQKLKSAKPVVKTVKRWTNKTRGFYKPVSTLLIEVFWSCCHQSGRAHRDCNFIYQLLWGYMHSHQDVCNIQQW